MGKLKPKRYLWEEIREKAEIFREQYVKPIDKVPVPIIEIVECDLNILPWPIKGLKSKIDIDGFLSKDLKEIFIDEDVYYDPRYENRLRFTFAYEVGHYVLHKEEIGGCTFRTEKEWIKFREDMSEDDLFWFEQQAYEFAGRLLVPVKQLNIELQSHVEKIRIYADSYGKNGEDILIRALSRVIGNKFQVSEGVIQRRIRNEKIIAEMINDLLTN